MWRDILARLLAGVDDPHQIFALVLNLTVCGLAVRCGGRVEKFAAVFLLAAYFASTYAHDLSRWVGPQYWVLVIDLVALTVLMSLALRTDRTWTLFAASFQLLTVLTHVAIGLDSDVRALAYAIVLNFLSYLVYAALAAGALEVLRSRRRQRRALEQGH